MTISQARKLLGQSSNNFTDQDIELLINQFLGIAEIVTNLAGSKSKSMGIEYAYKKEEHENR